MPRGSKMRSAKKSPKTDEGSEYEQYDRGRFRYVNQIHVPEVTASGQRTDDTQITEYELFGQTALSHIAEAEGTETTTKRSFEDVVVGVVVKTAAEILC